MQRILLASVAGFALLGASAQAADLPARSMPVSPAPVMVAPIFTWTGLYVGLNAGGAWTGDRCNGFRPVNGNGAAVPGFVTGCNSRGGDDVAFTGGGQIGYNWQFGSLVTGIEADINYLGGSDRRRSTLVVGAPAPGAFQGTYLINEGRDHGNYFGTVRARLGFAANRALFYVTGGLAYGESGRASTATFVSNPVGNAAVYTSRRSGDRVGFAVGAGIEYAIANNWSVRGEYLFADVGGGRRGRYNCTTTAGTACADQFGAGGAAPGGAFVGGRGGSNGVHVFRVGVNYLFNSSRSGGVVAAY